MAYGKLQGLKHSETINKFSGILDSAATLLPGRHVLNSVLLGGNAAALGVGEFVKH